MVGIDNTCVGSNCSFEGNILNEYKILNYLPKLRNWFSRSQIKHCVPTIHSVFALTILVRNCSISICSRYLAREGPYFLYIHSYTLLLSSVYRPQPTEPGFKSSQLVLDLYWSELDRGVSIPGSPVSSFSCPPHLSQAPTMLLKINQYWNKTLLLTHLLTKRYLHFLQ